MCFFPAAWLTKAGLHMLGRLKIFWHVLHFATVLSETATNHCLISSSSNHCFQIYVCSFVILLNYYFLKYNQKEKSHKDYCI